MAGVLTYSICVALLAVSLFITSASTRFIGDQILKSGNKPNACGAIIAQCIARCSSRTEDGTEYVQMTIAFVNNDTKCVTKETTGTELISTNPPNKDRGVVVFNVPCCQQRAMSASSIESRTSDPVGSQSQSQSTETKQSITTVTTTTSQNLRNSLAPWRTTSTASVSQMRDTKENLQLAFTIIGAILALIILVILLWHLHQERKRKNLHTDVIESSCETHPTSNGAVLVSVKNEKVVVPQETQTEKDASAEESFSLYSRKSEQRSGQSNSNSVKEPSDYVQLETVIAQNNPKSMKSSRSRTDEKSEEVLIIGTGSHAFPASGNYRRIQKDDVRSANHQGDIPEGDREQTNQQNHKPSLKRTELLNESEYCNLMPSQAEGVDVNVGTTSRPHLEEGMDDVRDTNGIYNVLRGEESEVTGDYQHLARIEPNQLAVYDVTNPKPTSNSLRMRSSEDEYVKDFQVLHSTQKNNGRTVPINGYQGTQHIMSTS